MKLIVGLGNPGSRYETTRHNAGFLVADALIRRCDPKARFQKKLWKNYAAFSYVEKDQPVTVLKPLTFMNRSGAAVQSALKTYGASASDCLIVMDDVYLPFGKLRFRPEGSAGGHNGLQSVIDVLGTTSIPRLRFGIGQSGNTGSDLANYVLGHFSGEELAHLDEVTQRAVGACRCWLVSSPDEVMRLFNS